MPELKYAIENHIILVDSQPVARTETTPGELNEAKLGELISAANRAAGSENVTPAQLRAGIVDDVDEAGAGGFLAAHHVPFVSPEMGAELIKIVKRLEVVNEVYPLPPTVDVYRLALRLVLEVAMEHQNAFCKKLEEALDE